MDGDIMNGKVLKIKSSSYEFGAQDRFINVLGCFKYIPNGNIYIIYSDIDPKYNIIYYGSGHVRDVQALCMQIRNLEEEEVIKEYIFKMINKESLDNFQFISLDSVEGIELIGSSKMEIKSEVLLNLIDMVIPKKEGKNEVVVETTPKEKKKNSNILLIFIAIIGIIGIFLLFLPREPKDTTEKSITCTKKYKHDTLTADIDETTKYKFNFNDKLEQIDYNFIYQFTKENYQDFILRGTIHKYVPSKKEGTWTKDDVNYIFTTTIKEVVDNSYNNPTDYEEVLSYNKKNGYTCTEKIESD